MTAIGSHVGPGRRLIWKGRAMRTLRIALLGPISISWDDGGAPVPLTGKPLALLAYLAVESDRPHRRDALAGLLWPDQPEEHARHSLRQALVTVRSALDDPAGGGCLAVSRQALGLAPECDLWIDLKASHEAIMMAERHRHPRGELCASCAALLETAVATYRGPFLGESLGVESDVFDEWVRHQRERLHHRILTAIDRLADHRARTGDLAGAITLVRRQLELDPWREPGYRRLMRLAMASGDRAGALAAYARCVEVLRDELGIDPEAETVALYERIQRAAGMPSPVAVAPPVDDLPVPITVLIGRATEMRELGDLLADPDCRLISLVGPGGIGKTRLALELARAHATSYAQGAAFVPLETAHTRQQVVVALANALHLPLRGPDPPEIELQRGLRERDLLLTLDNLEQVPEAGPMIADLLRAAPRLSVLTTSRTRLQIAGEWVYELRGLSTPATADAIDAPATACFLRVARLAGAHPALDGGDRDALLRICRLVEGMPLALAMAAGWTPTLSLPEIADEIERGIDLLATSASDAPARHRSMRAVCDASWALLTADEREVFRRLSVFRGGFDRDAAAAIAGATLPVLAALLAKSLIRRSSDGRYSIHELLRHYGEDRLRADPGVSNEVRDRHGAWFAEFVQRRELRLTSHQQVAALAEIDADAGNIRTAWRWAVRRGRAAEINQSAHGLWLYHVVHGRMADGDALFGEAVAALTRLVADGVADPVVVHALATALVRQGGFRNGLGHYEQARERLEAGITLLRELGDARELGLALNFLAAAQHLAGGEEEALLIESRELLTAVGDRWALGYTLSDLGIVALGRRDLDAARNACEQSRATFAALGDRRGLALACEHLGEIALAAGDLEGARRLHAESLRLRRLADDQWGVIASLMALGVVARAAGELAAARRHLVAALDAGATSQVWPVLLDVLMELALVMEQDGRPRAAWAIAAPVLAHPSCNQRIREKAARLSSLVDSGAGRILSAGEASERVTRLVAALRRGASVAAPAVV